MAKGHFCLDDKRGISGAGTWWSHFSLVLSPANEFGSYQTHHKAQILFHFLSTPEWKLIRISGGYVEGVVCGVKAGRGPDSCDSAPSVVTPLNKDKTIRLGLVNHILDQ